MPCGLPSDEAIPIARYGSSNELDLRLAEVCGDASVCQGRAQRHR